MWSRLCVALSLAAATMSGSASGATRIRIPHPERYKMSPAERHAAVLADLETVLTGPASESGIATAPYVSSRNGLCRRDVISVNYRPVKYGSYDSPFKPEGLGQVYTQYHYLDGEENHDGKENGTLDGWQTKCAQLTDDKIVWTTSPDDMVAAFALSTLESIVADVRNNKRFTMNCKELSAEEEAQCASEFLNAAAQVQWADRCTGQLPDCYNFGAGSYFVTVVRTYSASADGGYSTEIKMEHPDIVVT